MDVLDAFPGFLEVALVEPARGHDGKYLARLERLEQVRRGPRDVQEIAWAELELLVAQLGRRAADPESPF